MKKENRLAELLLLHAQLDLPYNLLADAYYSVGKKGKDISKSGKSLLVDYDLAQELVKIAGAALAMLVVSIIWDSNNIAFAAPFATILIIVFVIGLSFRRKTLRNLEDLARDFFALKEEFTYIHSGYTELSRSANARLLELAKAVLKSEAENAPECVIEPLRVRLRDCHSISRKFRLINEEIGEIYNNARKHPEPDSATKEAIEV